MWFVKDLTEFAAEAKTMLTGGDVDVDGNPVGQTSSAMSDPSPTRPEDVVRSPRETSDDGRGSAREAKASSSTGGGFLERFGITLVDDEEGEEDEEDGDDENGKPRSSRRDHAEAMAKLEAQLKAKEDNEQRLQAIVVAQQRRIKELEEMVSRLQADAATRSNAPATGSADAPATVPTTTTAAVAGPSAGSLNASGTNGTAVGVGTPTSEDTSSAININTPARHEGGYESWEDFGPAQRPALTGGAPAATTALKANTTTTPDQSPARKDEDEDWANFV